MSENARPIYFVGDSNTLAFQFVAFPAPQSGETLVTTTCRVAMRSCADLLDGDALNATLETFVRGRLRRPAGARDPVIVLMAGTIDFAAILRTIGPRADVHGFERAHAAFAGPAFPLIPAALLDGLIERHFEPLVRTIALLKDAGFSRLVLHSLHPPTLDDARYFAVRRVACSARVRYGTIAAINRHFARICRAANIAFLDLWDATTAGGVLDERLSLDGDHLNYEGALLTLAALLDAGLY